MKSRTYIATPPGATIREQLQDRGMTQKEFAVRMGMSEKHISHLINGDVQLTQDMAIRLETVLGVPATFWNNLEAIYREKLAKVEAESAMDADIEMVKQFPYAEMARYGWVPNTRKSIEKVMNLRRYFEVVNLSLITNTQIARIAYRRNKVTDRAELALLAWVQEARIKARDITTARFDVRILQDALPQIRSLTTLPAANVCQALSTVLADCGVALVFLPHLKSSYLQGATFVDGNRIVVAMTNRGKTTDIFWFSLFHELAHICLNHLSQENGTSTEDEQLADAWSADHLISTRDFERLMSANDFDETYIRSFASNIGIAPGIVVGRLQKEGLIRFDQMNSLKEQYNFA